MDNKELCPCCGRHCDLSEPNCERGKEYLRTGVIPEHHHGKGRPSKEERQSHYQAVDIQEKLFINLHDLSHVMRLLHEGKGSQKRILIMLNEVGSITQRELTERLGIQPGSVSEVIAKLEDAGYIIRNTSEEDRRTMTIELTETGKKRALEIKEERNRRHEEMFSCLSDDEKNTLLSLFEKINSDWEKRYQETEEKHHHFDHHHGEHHRKGHHIHEDHHHKDNNRDRERN